MTLPITTILPIHSGKIQQGGKELDSYMRELIFTLQRQYEDLANAINGDFKRSVDPGSFQWTPVVGDSADNDTTFNYDHQVGLALRTGLLVDIWFDVEWTSVASGTTAGNMEIDLPYQVTESLQKPFVGVVQPSVFTYTGGTECVINARPESFLLDVWNVGDGFTTANQGSVTAGHLIGNIRYVGKEIERS